MDELIKELERFKDMTSTFTLTDVAIVFALSFALTLVVTWTYRDTHRGVSYSQSYAHTLVIMGMTVALIMLIIGSNIARAFTLIGALSIIRFRNAVKETRDVGFMFVSMAIGMACGTRFYTLAVMATATLCAVVVVLDRLNLFSKHVIERILRVRLPADLDYERAFEPVFDRLLMERRLISVETVTGGMLQEVIYSVVTKSGIEPQALLEAVREINGNNKVALVVGQQDVDV
jgi:uncharacterized membrane protein YhiD involved in acid resistance